jgi:4-amino-4-deoxy-L-arabinose transferase-like glycosyltransferase
MNGPTRQTRLTAEHAVGLIAAGCLLFGAWGLHAGWTHSIVDLHAFRQTQTALTAVTIQRGGPLLAYETPIFGPPWTIPFELPVFQAIVASVSTATRSPLEQTGRAVSVAFFAGCLALLYWALGTLSIRHPHRLAFMALVAVSPVYVFWSRTFMIESTALFFALAFFCLTAAALRQTGIRAGAAAIAAAVTGSLAGAIKVTTFVPFGAAAAVLCAWHLRSGTRGRTLPALALLMLLVPGLASMGWLRFTERTKAENALGARIVASQPYMREHNFGTLRDRLTFRNWFVPPATAIGGRTRHTILGSVIVFALALAAAATKRQRAMQAALCLLLYALPIALFMRLHLDHVYYQYANGIFLIAAVGLGVVACLEQHGRRWLGVALLAMAVVAMGGNYLGGYYRDQIADVRGAEPLAVAIRQASAPQDVILLYGLDWSSEVPYRADRRAIMDWENLGLDHPAMRSTVARLGPPGITVVAACGASRTMPSVVRSINVLMPGRAPRVIGECDLYSGG